MKTDLYTKTILTVIAVILTANLFKATITAAVADSKKYVTLPVNADGSINVNINKVTAPMEVKITDVDRSAFYYVMPIPVKVTQ